MTLNWLNINRFIRQLTFVSLLTLFCTTSFAGIYKWTDAEGNVHYSQQRPRDTSSEKMNVPQHAPTDTSTYKRPALQSNDSENKNAADDKQKSDEPEEVKETKAEKKRRLAECEQVRQNLATMESRGRVRSKDKDGNTRYLSQQEKEDRMASSRKKLAKYCK